MITEHLDSGTGRAFCLLVDNDHELILAKKISEQLEVKSRLLIYSLEEINQYNWQELSKTILEEFKDKKVRQVSMIGIKAAGAIAQNIALIDRKLCRSLILINTTTRPHPTSFSRVIDRIESILPLGLPLRQNSLNFDSKPFLQRLRCPALIITTQNSNEHEKSEAMILTKRIPTAWYYDSNKSNTAEDLAKLISEFEAVPAKCPQKNLQRKA